MNKHHIFKAPTALDRKNWPKHNLSNLKKSTPYIIHTAIEQNLGALVTKLLISAAFATDEVLL